MKYTTRELMIAITIVAAMVATVRVPSAGSVVALLFCVCGLFGYSAVLYFVNVEPRKVYAAVALTGFAYLFVYVATNTPVESCIDTASIIPYSLLKAGPTMLTLPSAELGPQTMTMEFHYFQQKMHLLLAVVLAFAAGWIAAAR